MSIKYWRKIQMPKKIWKTTLRYWKSCMKIFLMIKSISSWYNISRFTHCSERRYKRSDLYKIYQKLKIRVWLYTVLLRKWKLFLFLLILYSYELFQKHLSPNFDGILSKQVHYAYSKSQSVSRLYAQLSAISAWCQTNSRTSYIETVVLLKLMARIRWNKLLLMPIYLGTYQCPYIKSHECWPCMKTIIRVSRNMSITYEF